MAKIHILGGSGSGKTTLARDLSSLLHVPHYDLDKIGLEKGIVTEDDAFQINNICSQALFKQSICGYTSRRVHAQVSRGAEREG